MTTWKIDVEEANGIIVKTHGVLDDLDGIETTLDTAVSDLVTALANPTLAGAVQDCNTQFMRPVAVSAHLQGTQICNKTQEAVNAYHGGDLVMAEDSQSGVDDLPVYDEGYSTQETSAVPAVQP